MMVSAESIVGANVPEIQALANRVQELSDRVDFWNLVMLWGLALAAFAAVIVGISTRLVIVRSGQFSAAQTNLDEAKEGKLKLDLKGKDLEIGALTIKSDLAAAGIAVAQGDALKAEQKAIEAKVAQQKIETQLAFQQQRAATAERDLLVLQETVRPRRLSESEKAQMVALLKEYPPAPFALSVTFEAQDGQAYMEDFKEVFDRSGWNLSPDKISFSKFSNAFTGLLIVAHDAHSVPAQANALIKALNAINIRPSPGFDVNIPVAAFELRIGTKQ